MSENPVLPCQIYQFGRVGHVEFDQELLPVPFDGFRAQAQGPGNLGRGVSLCQEVQDFLARRLYDMTGEIMMSLLIMADATVAPELFLRSAKVYVRMAEETVAGKSAYIFAFNKEELSSFRAVEA